ncbi:MAG: hypothetical protein D6752_02260 [Candidatus Nitrosothermus koennekii]|nr:MAG: hypothetical protein D6752_02260 [Candidatus Nitrosothermus koennekii]
MSKESILDTVGILSKVAINTGLSLTLTTAKMASITNKSIGAAIDTYIKLLEEEMKPVKEKVSIE